MGNSEQKASGESRLIKLKIEGPGSSSLSLAVPYEDGLRVLFCFVRSETSVLLAHYVTHIIKTGLERHAFIISSLELKPTQQLLG